MQNDVRLRSVALPTEHGGWSLTLEPVILGLLVAPSGAGFALGGATLLAFVIRTPLKVLLVDGVRGRRLPRTRRASAVVAAEIALLAVLSVVAIILARAPFWWPLLLAAPLVLLELWFDARSRSRRLIPELAGSVGIGAAAAAIALAGAATDGIALGLWIVIAARVIAAVPFVRAQLRRAKGQAFALWHSDLAQAGGIAVALAGVAFSTVPIAAAASIGVLAIADTFWVRRPPPRAPVLGSQQVVAGLLVVLVSGLAVRVP